MKQLLSFFGCKQPYARSSFVAGGDCVLNTCNGGKIPAGETTYTFHTESLGNGIYFLQYNAKLKGNHKLIIQH